jgi:hypothetical protein
MHDENYRYKYGMLISYYENPQAIQAILSTLPDSGISEHEFTVNK